MLKKWNITTIIRQRFLWKYFVVLYLHQHSHLTNQFSLHILAILTFTSHLNTLRVDLVQYICHIHNQTNHITLSTIIRTCPRSVKVSILSNPTSSTFWLVVLISNYLVINLNLNHSSKKGIYSELKHMRQSVLFIRTIVCGIIFVKNKKILKPRKPIQMFTLPKS